MLRNLGIRAKILAVLAVPVILVTVVSVVLAFISVPPLVMIALLVGAGIVGLVVHAVLASIVAGSISRPLADLAAAADEVSRSLPSVIERVSANEDVEFTEIPVTSSDEVGRLAASINDLSTTTIDFARERAAFAKDQADVRGSIANMFVNVARRDQTLLKRVLSQVTEMERTEEDPDTLDKLFKLDHLATRMRRNAESLLVLAGRESSRRRRQPMPLTDVARSASSEIEHYERIDLHQYIDPAMLGHAALPTSHLLAELLENATRYSDPGSRVTVEAGEGPKGVRIVISDTGLGMSGAELAMFNDRIANPPTEDVIGTEKMGFYVVGRLAQKLGATVVLSSAQPKGIVATVDLGAALFVPGTVATTEEPAEDFGLGAAAGAPGQEQRGALSVGGNPAAAALAAAAASQGGQINPEIVAAPARPGGLPVRTSLPSRGARAGAAADAPDPAGGTGQDQAPAAQGPAVPTQRAEGGEASRARMNRRAGASGAKGELTSLSRRGPSPAAAAKAAKAADAAPAGGGSALDILPGGAAASRGRGRKKIQPQAPMPSVSAMAAAAAAQDEGYVPQAFVPTGPVNASSAEPAQDPSGGSLSDVLRARSAMASAALSELSQIQGGAPLVRRERGASEAGRLAAANQAAAQTPAPSRPTRSAADVRSMLSGFQAGVSRGRTADTPAPEASSAT